MSLQNLIEEREKLANAKFPEILGLEVFPDGTDNQLCIRDEDDEIIESIDFSDEVKELKQFHSNSINMIIEGVVEMVNEELEIQNKIQEKAKEIVVVGRQKVNEMLQDKYIRQGKIEALNNIISQLQTLKK